MGFYLENKTIRDSNQQKLSKNINNIAPSILQIIREGSHGKSSLQPGPDDKLVPTMIYTPQRLLWGRLITKKLIRVCIWLQTAMAPIYPGSCRCSGITFGAGQDTRNLRFPLLHVEKEQISAYHILPPADESPYFDIEEPFRKMEPVAAHRWNIPI